MRNVSNAFTTSVYILFQCIFAFLLTFLYSLYTKFCIGAFNIIANPDQMEICGKQFKMRFCMCIPLVLDCVSSWWCQNGTVALLCFAIKLCALRWRHTCRIGILAHLACVCVYARLKWYYVMWFYEYPHIAHIISYLRLTSIKLMSINWFQLCTWAKNHRKLIGYWYNFFLFSTNRNKVFCFPNEEKKYGTLEFFCKKLLILNYALNVHVNAHNQIKIFWSIM